MPGKLWICTLLLCALTAGCEEEDEVGPPIATSLCASGLKWASGNAESPLMHPGGDCIGCHSQGEGPSLVIAGTVYGAPNEPQDCYGVEGVSVLVTGANGQEVELVTNAAGNFYLTQRDSSLTMPIRARVESAGGVNAMAAAQESGSCNSCHTEGGANGAPGRILVP